MWGRLYEKYIKKLNNLIVYLKILIFYGLT